MKTKQTNNQTLAKQITAAVAQGMQAFCMVGAIISTALVFMNVVTPSVSLSFMSALKVNENVESIYANGTEVEIQNTIDSLINLSTQMVINFAIAAGVLACIVWFLSQRDRHDNLRLATALGAIGSCIFLASFSQYIVRVMLSSVV